MPFRLRLACVAAAALLLVGLPVGNATVLLAMVLALDVAVAALALALLKLARQSAPRTVVPVRLEAAADPVSLHLLRRTVPELRGRRPPVVIAAQVRWRQAAETRRRDVAFWSALAVRHQGPDPERDR